MASYLEIYALRNDAEFRARVGMAVIVYATYLLGQPAADGPRRGIEVSWARNASVSTDDMVFRVLGFVLGSAAVQSALGAVTDEQLQLVVEDAVRGNIAAMY